MSKPELEAEGDNAAATPSGHANAHAHSQFADGDEDPREIRRRAREALKAAKAQMRAAREPLPFDPKMMALTIAGVIFDLVLAGGLIMGQSRGTLYDNVDAAATSTVQKDAAPGTLEILPAPVPVADITFADAAGKTHALSEFKGEVVVLNIWASWCTPCKTEMPALAALHTRYADKEMRVLAVSIDNADKFGDAKRFIGINAPLKFYSTGMDVVVKSFGISGMPATLIIDRQGREVARVNGAANWDTPEVTALMDKLTK